MMKSLLKTLLLAGVILGYCQVAQAQDKSAPNQVQIATYSSQSTSHPHPTLQDEWIIGTETHSALTYTDNIDYSYYMVYNSGHGSIAALVSKNNGKEVAKDIQDYGQARARHTWAWNDPSGFHQLWGTYSY